MTTIDPIDSANQQPISDDQELAKVLAGVDQQADDAADAGAGTTFVEPTVTTPAPPIEESEVTAPVMPDPAVAVPAVDPLPASEPLSAPAVGAPGSLDSVKQEALNELRPLVDKLDVSAEEKFDTYLLLLRSTDDRDLIAPAHEAAKGIADEARRAQALLDIIKEIDFLSQNAAQ